MGLLTSSGLVDPAVSSGFAMVLGMSTLGNGILGNVILGYKFLVTFGGDKKESDIKNLLEDNGRLKARIEK